MSARQRGWRTAGCSLGVKFRCGLRRLVTPLKLLSHNAEEQDPDLLHSTANHISYPLLPPKEETRHTLNFSKNCSRIGLCGWQLNPDCLLCSRIVLLTAVCFSEHDYTTCWVTNHNMNHVSIRVQIRLYLVTSNIRHCPFSKLRVTVV